MRILNLLLLLIALLGSPGCQAQSAKKMNNSTNPLLCDPDTGLCELPLNKNAMPTAKIPVVSQKPIRIIYFTDPICSSCWGIEPQLRKLKLAYGTAVDIEYRMGGLLPDWSYNSGGISKPSDVAHHWDEVSVHYDMPIDGDVWLEDPLSSSFPPSIAFTSAALQDRQKAVIFLRALREMVFLEKKNITKWEHIEAAAIQTGLDVARLKMDMAGAGKMAFEDDLKLAKALGVRGFPTMFISNEAGSQEMGYGSKPFSVYEAAISKLCAECVPVPYDKDWKSLFHTIHHLQLKNFRNYPEWNEKRLKLF